MKLSIPLIGVIVAAGLTFNQGSASAEVTLVEDGEAKAVIHVPQRLWDDPQANPEADRTTVHEG